jgi:hypothetical protein
LKSNLSQGNPPVKNDTRKKETVRQLGLQPNK